MAHPTIGVIGGSGLYEIEGLAQVQRLSLETPFGAPSDAYVTGLLEGRKLVFLPRHGRGHRILPGEVNYRANVHGLKQLGCTHVISISAVGSMRPEIEPGHVVMVDQLFDRTRGHRAASFFGDGIAGHIQFADPMCAALSRVVGDAAREAGATVHDSGTYLCIDGPQFSTRAESRIYRSWGVDVIGMTAIPEAKLAREAGLCYATVAMSTDYDCWHEEEEDVSVGGIIETLRRNVALARQIIRTAALRISEPELRQCACPDAARQAVITDRAVWPAETRKRLALILGQG